MNGELALLAALAAVGGRWLRDGATTPAPELLRGNSSFQYVGSFVADLPSRGFLRRTSAVASPEELLLALGARGTTDLLLITELTPSGPLPPHLASAFSNSGTWALLATGEAAPTLWTIGWEVGHQHAKDSRIWALNAHSSGGNGFHTRHLELGESRARLRTALEEIRAFAEQADEVRDWASWFEKSANLLEDPAPAAPYHQDLLPPDASLERRQLAAAVVQGWVFGGMGSWNDGGCIDPQAHRQYERLGANLYAALLVALPAATNGA